MPSLMTRKQTTTNQEKCPMLAAQDLTFSCHSMVQPHLTIIFISPLPFVSAISLEVNLNGWLVPPLQFPPPSKKARHPLKKWDRCSRWRNISLTSLAFLWTINKHWPTGKVTFLVKLKFQQLQCIKCKLNIFASCRLLSSIPVNHSILLSVVATSYGFFHYPS